ncbi:hypothetical protein [Microbacterium sp. P04]|uniref:hypothetical protein n=1 Tax=Microbacterium sp. P04 TaxID=3366947 RepID=UPI003746884E
MRFNVVRRARLRVGAVLAIFAVALGVLSGVGSQPANASQGAQAIAAAPAASAVKPVLAADLSKFRAGNIISDSRFFDSGTMSEAQIQQFLDTKVRTCQSGYTCLKDWYDTSRTTGADAMCGAYSGGYRERASTIIYKVSRACGINPQVILTMLEKEQGLVTHTWPSEFRFRAAMGQGCPDTAACDTRYYGFFNQVYGGAWQMKRYANPPGTSNFFNWYAPGKTWNVLYNPNRDCGSTPVYIENQATANLYYYTPYQPNAAALRAGYGTGDGCSAYGNRNFYNLMNDWFGSAVTSNNPIGNLETAEAVPGGVHVRGWAIDPNSAESLAVHVYVGTAGTAIPANLDRADVAAAHPAAGSRHGFDTTLPVDGPGDQQLCVYAINVGAGEHVLLGCRTIDGYTGPPVGQLDELVAGSTSLTVRGWALDPDSADPVDVQLVVDGVPTTIRASASRPDLLAHYPAHGASHGYSTTVALSPTANSVCVVAVNVARGADVTLGCRSVLRPATSDLNRPSTGNLESVIVGGDAAVVTGWALDPDTSAPIKVHAYVNAAGKEFTADVVRSDVGAAYPAYGPRHGFSITLQLPVGESTVCVYAINTKGENRTLGCRTVTSVDTGRAPVGNFETVTVNGTKAAVAGWAIDPDTARPVKLEITVGSTLTEMTADGVRPDVANAYPAYGASHGFTGTFDIPPGPTEVCVWAINTAGPRTSLGCRTARTADLARTPIGNVEQVEVKGSKATITGWALDPDTAEDIAVHVYVGQVGTAFSADLVRGDVQNAYPVYGAMHGFKSTVLLPKGQSTVCVYAINTAGPNPQIGCKAVSSMGGDPIGNLESVQPRAGGLSATGWAIDPDVSTSIPVHIYVDGVGRAYNASSARADVGNAYPGYTDAHGFSVDIPAASGVHRVCAYGINDSGETNTTLGCRSVSIP